MLLALFLQKRTLVPQSGVSSNSAGVDVLADFSSSTFPSHGSAQASQVDLDEILDAVVELDEQLTDAGFHADHMEPGL